MKKRVFACALTAVLLAMTSWANDKEKDEDRLKNASTVLTEILNIPDNIPQYLVKASTQGRTFVFGLSWTLHDPKLAAPTH